MSVAINELIWRFVFGTRQNGVYLLLCAVKKKIGSFRNRSCWSSKDVRFVVVLFVGIYLWKLDWCRSCLFQRTFSITLCFLWWRISWMGKKNMVDFKYIPVSIKHQSIDQNKVGKWNEILFRLIYISFECIFNMK